jgi:hypothetical protein
MYLDRYVGKYFPGRTQLLLNRSAEEADLQNGM